MITTNFVLLFRKLSKNIIYTCHLDVCSLVICFIIFFHPLESTLTIHECDQDEALEPIQPIIINNKKPPVPKRIGQLRYVHVC